MPAAADCAGLSLISGASCAGAPVAATATLAGLQVFKGTISLNNLKDPQDPQWADDAEMKGYVAWMNADFPKPDIKNGYIFSGWSLAASLVENPRHEVGFPHESDDFRAMRLPL